MTGIQIHPRPNQNTSVGTQKAAWLARAADIAHVQSLVSSGALVLSEDQAVAVDRAQAEARAALSQFAARRRAMPPRL